MEQGESNQSCSQSDLQRLFRGALTSFSISVIMSRSGCCKAGGGKGKANVQHWPEENHQICVL